MEQDLLLDGKLADEFKISEREAKRRDGIWKYGFGF
jgi:hypothetical protein